MLNEDELLEIADNGKTYLENLLLNQIKNDISWCTFNKEKSLRIILRYRRYDLLKYVSIGNMLRQYGGKRYLNYIIEELKNRKDYKNLVMEPFERCSSLEQIVDVYMIYCKEQCLNFLPKITKEQLLSTEKNKINRGRTLQEVFKNKKVGNESLVLFIINKYFKNDQSVIDDFQGKQVINQANDEVFFEPSIEFNDETPSLKYVSYYNNRYYDDYESLNAYDKRLIDNLCYKLSFRCNKEIIDIFKRSYSSQLALNIKGVRKEINLLYEILDNDESFKIVYGNNSNFSPSDNILYLSTACIDIFNHEIGHVLFHKIARDKIEDEFEYLTSKIRNNHKHLEKVKELSDLFHKESKKSVEKATKVHDDNEFLGKNDKKEYDNFVANRQKSVKDLSKQGIDDETIERLLTCPISFEDFKERKRNDRIGKLKYSIMRCDNADISAICDIVDAIYQGEFRNSLLKDKNGNKIKSCTGHGLYYYNKDNTSVFNEIIANYSLLKKSVSKDAMKLLKYFTSGEFVNYLDNYYNQIILEGTIEKIDSRFM